MSFSTMKKADLLQVAEDFAVDVQPTAGNAEIIAALAEEGVTFEQWKTFQPKEDTPVETEEVKEVVKAEKPTKVKQPDQLLVKMNRQNPHYEIFGKVFTKEHPFVVCTPGEAQSILDAEDGFNIASPREAQEYYS